MRVSALTDWRHSALIAVHELVEALLCKAHGVTTEAVDTWDMGPGHELDEPGDDPRAPYHREHELLDAWSGCWHTSSALIGMTTRMRSMHCTSDVSMLT